MGDYDWECNIVAYRFIGSIETLAFDPALHIQYVQFERTFVSTVGNIVLSARIELVVKFLW